MEPRKDERPDPEPPRAPQKCFRLIKLEERIAPRHGDPHGTGSDNSGFCYTRGRWCTVN